MGLPRGGVLRCIECGEELDDRSEILCRACGGLLEFVLEDGFPTKEGLFGPKGPGIWRFGAALPVDKTSVVTLGEGQTPLVPCANMTGIGEVGLYVKNEGQNPTGSFKDRGITVAVSNARSIGAKTLVCASTGNTSASASAYAARAGIRSVVLVPSGKIAAGKLLQARIYGSKIVRVEGNFDRSMKMVLGLVSKKKGFYLVNSANPYRIEGQKTAAYEVCWELKAVPDYVVLPVGNAGNISAYWKGFEELFGWGIVKKKPKMVGVQASGAAPMAEAFLNGRERIKPWDSPETVASAIRIGNPVSWRKALKAVKESDGFLLDVTDREILAAQGKLAALDGMFVEPASAAPLAAIRKLKGKIERGAKVVCVATGSGLKDPSAVDIDVEKMPLVSDVGELMKLLQCA